MTKAPTVIIGGGLAGVASLFELARRGVEAILIEARDDVALETSFANGGMLTPSMADPWNGPGVGGHLFSSLFGAHAALTLRPRALPGLAFWGLRFLRNSAPARFRRAAVANFTLAVYSLQRTEALREEFGLDYDWARRGALKLFESRKAMAGSLAAAEILAPHGLNVEIADADRAVAIEPQLADIRERIAGALYYPDDGAGDARKFTLGLADEARKLGAEIRTGVRVIALTTENGRIAGVETDAGPIEARRVILAAGAASPALAGKAGAALPIKPVKGYSLTFDLTGQQEAMRALPRLPVIDEAVHGAITPLGARLRAGGMAEFAGFDKTLRADGVARLRALLARLYPALSRQLAGRQGEAWTGLRPMSVDGTPFIGATRVDGLWANTGHGHLGWTMAAGSGALIADLMLGLAPAIDPHPYRAQR